MDSRGRSELTLALDAFAVERDPAGRPEQFRSSLRILDGDGDGDGDGSGDGSGSGSEEAGRDPLKVLRQAEISVNHPLRFRGVTFYQADWGLAAISVQLGRSPVLQLPLQSFPQLGEQVWGLVLPTRPDGTQPVLLSLTSEQGPVDVYGADGTLLGSLAVGGPAQELNELPIRVESVLPASGILLKRDPGVPLVYAGFAIALVGGGLSLLATRQLWAIAEPGRLHLAGLCNRNLTALARELPQLLNGLAEPT
jgi:cytochrome c biogenesis protein